MGIPLPDGYHSVNAYIVVDGAERLIGFLDAAFDGAVHELLPAPDGLIGHAEVRIGDSIVMLTDGKAGHPAQPCSIYLYVDDVDATYRRALDAGATSVMEPADQFYGDRNGGVVDPTGNTWWIATHLEDLSSEEILERSQAR
jgi:PhnB protein